jgi:hypothetical protein
MHLNHPPTKEPSSSYVLVTLSGMTVDKMTLKKPAQAFPKTVLTTPEQTNTHKKALSIIRKLLNFPKPQLKGSSNGKLEIKQ